jgi:hypothetical protein
MLDGGFAAGAQRPQRRSPVHRDTAGAQSSFRPVRACARAAGLGGISLQHDRRRKCIGARTPASAARELDEHLFRQEFEASFESSGYGEAYHAFSYPENVRRCEYVVGQPLIWSVDFNVHPMCSVLAQRHGEAVEVLDEMAIENAHTILACDALLKKIEPWLKGHPLTLEVYGDASGHQRRTSGTDTDWGLIRDYFGRLQGQIKLQMRTTAVNPGVRDRINIVNSRLRSAAGERRLFIDPKCKELIKDLERVSWQTDAAGRVTSELDKSDRLRTHSSDALGYFLAQAFPMRNKMGERRDGWLI